MSKKKIDYLETFLIPGIDILYPVYAVSESGKIMNFKSIIYPNSKSKRKFTRNKQLSKRSLQAKIFDSLIRIGYFNPLEVILEFPVIIQNSRRLKNQEGLYYLLDYYFPDLCLAVELDSDLHNREKDEIRDKYLENLGIKVWRLENFDKPKVQEKDFKDLTKFMRDQGTKPRINFNFQEDIKKTLL